LRKIWQINFALETRTIFPHATTTIMYKNY